MNLRLFTSFVSLFLFCFFNSPAQAPQYEKCCGTASSQFPFKNNGGAKTQLWYNPSDFTVLPPNGQISAVYFRSQVAGQSGTYIDFQISMKQPTSGTQFSGATGNVFETGLTPVYFNSLEVVNGASTIGGWYYFTLHTPFTYDNTLPLVIEVLFTPPFSGVGLDNYGTSTTAFKKIYTGTATNPTGTPSNSWWQDIGIDVVTVCSGPPVAGTATASDTVLCSGDSTDLDLTGHSFGTGQTYQWESSASVSGPYSPVSGVLTDPAFSVSATAASTYFRCALTCASMTSLSAPVHVVADALASPGVSISGSAAICVGETGNFTAVPTNGGTNPKYQWKKNTVNVGTNSANYTDNNLNNNDLIECELTSNQACLTGPAATSNAILVKVSPLPAKPTVSVNGVELTASTSFAYQWRLDGNDLPGAVSKTHTATVTGWYSVLAIAANQCSSSSDSTFVDITIGLNEPSKEWEVMVFPTPFSDELNVLLPYHSGVVIEIRNMLGEVVFDTSGTGSSHVLDLSSLQSGLYFMTVRQAGDVFVKQIVRE